MLFQGGIVRSTVLLASLLSGMVVSTEAAAAKMKADIARITKLMRDANIRAE